MDFQKKIGKFSERQIYLSEYIAVKLPQASGHSKIELVGISSTILPEHNGSELAVNSDFTIRDTARKLVDTPCRRGKFSHQYNSKPNSQAVKHQTSYKNVVTPLPGLEPLMPSSFRNQINKLDKSENSNHNLNRSTENTKHSSRSISVGKLDRNLLRLKK